MDRYAIICKWSCFGRSVTDADLDFEKLDKDRAGVIWGSGIMDWKILPNRNAELYAGDLAKNSILSFQNDFVILLVVIFQ
jgi:3-oxoacyl-[acyl-carrier-protein] synthase II